MTQRISFSRQHAANGGNLNGNRGECCKTLVFRGSRTVANTIVCRTGDNVFTYPGAVILNKRTRSHSGMVWGNNLGSKGGWRDVDLSRADWPMQICDKNCQNRPVRLQAWSSVVDLATFTAFFSVVNLTIFTASLAVSLTWLLLQLF